MLTYSFADPATPDKLRLAGRRSAPAAAVPLRNPLREDQALLRTSLVGGMLETAARNVSRRVTDVHVFEIGAVYVPRSLPLTDLPDEPRRIGILMTVRCPSEWWGTSPAPPRFMN